MLYVYARLAATMLAAVFLAIVVVPIPSAGQVTSDSSSIEDHIGRILEYAAERENSDVEEMVRELRELAAHPLNLNTASVTELRRLPVLTALQASRIVRFREAFVPFAAVSELRAVEGITAALVRAMRPFVAVRDDESGATETIVSSPSPPVRRQTGRSVNGRLMQSVGRRIERGRGYTEASGSGPVYSGSPYRMTTRMRLRYGELLTGNLTLDKDPAERLEWDPAGHTYGFDFWSGHLAYGPSEGSLERIVVGDFVPAFGQGLVFARGSGMSGSSRRPVRSMIAHRAGIQPYRSTRENSFFRGAAATLQLLEDFHISAFTSRRSLDASLNPAADGTGMTVSRRLPDGYHRTPPERLRKDVLQETVVGGAVEWSTGASGLGVAAYRSTFSHPFAADDRPSEQFDFAGRKALMLGMQGETLIGPSHWFGEVARAPTGAFGGIGGVAAELTDGVETIVLARHYPRDFMSLYGHAYGAGGGPQNETGVYTALRLRRFDDWDLAASFDQFWFPWLRYNIGRPTTGYAATISTTFDPYDDLEVYLRFRSSVREKSAQFPDRSGIIRGVAPAARQTVRLQTTYEPGQNWRFRTRAELSRARDAGSNTHFGSLLYQDLRWRPLLSLRLDGRFTLFHAENYAARLYTYENDLLYSFSVPALFGRGRRAYLLAAWELTDDIVLAGKYAVSRYLDRKTVGSGWDEVFGSRLREVRFQLRVRW